MIVLSASNLAKVYGTDVIIENVDFHVNNGDRIGLVGRNGAGKTTLMNTLYGLHQPTSGTIYIDGRQAVIHSPKDSIAMGIGMVQQHFSLVPSMTVAENIVMGNPPYKKNEIGRASCRERVSSPV